MAYDKSRENHGCVQMKKRVEVEGPLKIGDVTLIVVIKSLLNGRCGKKSAWFFGMKSPIALVFMSDSSKRVFRYGDEISIEKLMEENPEINIDL